MDIFEYNEYKNFLRDWVKEHPRGGRGQLRKMAAEVNVSTTLLSQVLNGDKHLSLETAAEVADYIGLSGPELEYFILMIEHERAGAFKLRNILEKKLQREQSLGLQLKYKRRTQKELTDAEKMTFYSSWIYSGIRLLSAIPQFSTSEAISTKLHLPLSQVNQIVDFLVSTGLCTRQGSKISYGTQFTHVEKDSPFVIKHHQNWRLKGFQKMELRREEDFFHTHSMALSKEAAEKIQQLLPRFIEQVISLAGPSSSEVVRCLSIDYFDFS